MEFIDIATLAVLQGAAEFLPISSSGHLVIAQNLLGINPPGMLIDISLHFGTLISICIFYFAAIKRIIFAKNYGYIFKIILSAIPAVVVYFVFRDTLSAVAENAKFAGALLIVTGFVLISTKFMPPGSKKVSLISSLAMGLCQAAAIFPGLSRSGMTLVGARACRVAPENAAEFSFLMSAPLIIGGIVLEMINNGKQLASGEVSVGLLLSGIFIAAVVGYFSIVLLVKTLNSSRFWLFGPYCIIIGILSLFFCK